MLRDSIAAQERLDVRYQIFHTFVGRDVGDGITTLDALPANDRRNTLIKIDVEGAELDVIGDRSPGWILPTSSSSRFIKRSISAVCSACSRSTAWSWLK